jgi:isopentenyl diphosphate isomerase/L-lactate dehydrogenase-like FMN-dependent dehydrogenase
MTMSTQDPSQSKHPGEARQSAIYLEGMAGNKPALPLDVQELEAQAKKKLKAAAFDYISGGAGAEQTMAANREAFQRWRIRPRVLRDVAGRSLRISLFGREYAAPIFVAPVGVQGIIHRDGDLATARAAAALDVPFIHSSAASKTMEEVAEASGTGPRWFQLYPGKDPEIIKNFLDRAAAAGYSAVVVTVDTPVIGWRSRDLQHGYLPFLKGEGLANYTSDPAFRRKLPSDDPAAVIRLFLQIFGNPSFDWAALRSVRATTSLPILLKGITHPEDAALAVEHGVNGIIVSNHGGRQVDGASGALDALPGVVEAVHGRVPVLFDSGIREGADVFKALALGAKAVLLGRPWTYGLALAGEAGVQEVFQNLIASFDTTLALAGKTSCAELSPEDLEAVAFHSRG